MSDSDKIVAAIFAASAMRKESVVTLDKFIVEYEGCLHRLAENEAGACQRL
jgi:hypothetical protein